MAKQKTLEPMAELKKLVNEIEIAEGLQPDEAFVLWFLRSHLIEEPTASRNCLTRRGNEKGVDAIYIDHSARQVNIIQGKYRTKGVGKPESRQDVLQLAYFGRLMIQDEDNLTQLAESADTSVRDKPESGVKNDQITRAAARLRAGRTARPLGGSHWQEGADAAGCRYARAEPA